MNCILRALLMTVVVLVSVGASSYTASAQDRPKTAAPLPYVPVVTPNGSTLPWTMKDGVKEFRLTAEPV